MSTDLEQVVKSIRTLYSNGGIDSITEVKNVIHELTQRDISEKIRQKISNLLREQTDSIFDAFSKPPFAYTTPTIHVNRTLHVQFVTPSANLNRLVDDLIQKTPAGTRRTYAATILPLAATVHRFGAISDSSLPPLLGSMEIPASTEMRDPEQFEKAATNVIQTRARILEGYPPQVINMLDAFRLLIESEISLIMSDEDCVGEGIKN